MSWMTAIEALRYLRGGMRVFIGSGCAAPQTLIEAFVARAPEVYDVDGVLGVKFQLKDVAV